MAFLWTSRQVGLRLDVIAVNVVIMACRHVKTLGRRAFSLQAQEVDPLPKPLSPEEDPFFLFF